MRADLPASGLTLYLPDAETEPALEQLQWLRTASTGDTKGTSLKGIGLSTLQAELSNRTDERPTRLATLIIPAEITVIAAVIVPSDKPQHIRAAAPNLLEESIASDVERLHLAYGARSAVGKVPLVAVDRNELASRLAAIEHSGLQCDTVLVDALLLRCELRTVTLALDGQRALLRWGECSAGAIETIALIPLLRAILRSIPIGQIDLWTATTPDPAVADFLREQLTLLQSELSFTVEQQTFDGSLIEFLLAQRSQLRTAPIDLRQGEFQASKRSNPEWRRWRPVAYVAAGLVVAQLLLNLATGLVLQHRAQNARVTAESLYRELFPNDRRLVNLQQQLQNQLGSLSGNNQRTFLELFGELASEIQKVPGTPPIQLRGIIYDATGGVLQVDMNIADVQALDDLQKRLSANHLQAKVLSAAAAAEGGITGRLSVSGK